MTNSQKYAYVYDSEWWEWAEKVMEEKIIADMTRLTTEQDERKIHLLQGEIRGVKRILDELKSKNTNTEE